MNISQRAKNEKEFEAWLEKEDGGRIYYFEIFGKSGWKAKYLKEVNSEEVTIQFWQEIYDDNNVLREIHEKYPVDKGHKSFKMITKNYSGKLLAYLQHRLSTDELADWAEKSFMESKYDDDESHTVRNILSQLGLADVKAFGLEYKDCEAIMQKLGYTLEINALSVA